MRGRLSWFGTLLMFGLVSRAALAEAPLPITAARVNGVYQQGENQISLLSLGHNKVRVELDLNNLAAAGYALGDATLNGDTLTYAEAPNGTRCKTLLKFLPKDQLEVGVYSECFFSPHIGASGTYRKLKGGVPKFASATPVTSSDIGVDRTPPSAEASFEMSATTVQLDATDAAELARRTAATLAQVTALAARRTQAIDGLKAPQAERAKHASAASAGYQKHRAGLGKATSSAAATEGLKQARAEAGQASTQGQIVLEKLAALRALEEELFVLSSKANELSLAANASAKDAQSVSSAMQAVVNAKNAKTPASTASAQLAKSTEAQRHAADARAAAASASADASKAVQAAGLGPLSGRAAKKAQAQRDDDKLTREIVQNNLTATQIDAALKPTTATAAPASTAIAGTTEIPSAEVRKRYGAMADETMQAHPEIVNAMKAFDPDSDVLFQPNDNRALRLSDGRELLLLSGRTCRACGSIAYWIVWDPKARLVAFERGESNVPVYGKPDSATRSVLEQFVKQTQAP